MYIDHLHFSFREHPTNHIKPATLEPGRLKMACGWLSSAKNYESDLKMWSFVVVNRIGCLVCSDSELLRWRWEILLRFVYWDQLWCENRYLLGTAVCFVFFELNDTQRWWKINHIKFVILIVKWNFVGKKHIWWKTFWKPTSLRNKSREIFLHNS